MAQAKPPRFPCPACWPVHHVSRLTFSVVRYSQIWPPIFVHPSSTSSLTVQHSLPAACYTLLATLTDGEQQSICGFQSSLDRAGPVKLRSQKSIPPMGETSF